MQILTLTRGLYETHGYLVSDGNASEALLLDPVEEGEQFVEEAEHHSLRIIAIVATHAHFDHIGGVAQAYQRLQVPFMIGAHAVESLRAERQRVAAYSPPLLIPEPPDPDRLLREGDQLAVGALRFTVLETPGHWHGDISLYEPEHQVVFSGDTLGREFIFDANQGCDVVTLLRSIQTKLMTLPDETKVYPGHGPATTIGHERANNPRLQR